MSSAPDWYRSFFHGIALELWWNAMPPAITSVEGEFLFERLGLARLASPTYRPRVLDVPCGNGRLTLELAARGCEPTGVDIAPENLVAARQAAQQRQLQAEFIEADMRDLPAREFDAAFCWGNCFGYLEEGGDEAFVAAVAQALRPGGRFILETHLSAEGFLPHLVPELSVDVGDIRLGLVNRVDVLTSRLHTQYTFTRDGVADVRHGSQKMYLVREVLAMLTRQGFRVLELVGGVSGQPFDVGVQPLTVVAERM